MTTILFGIARICCPRFKRNYLSNEKLLLILLFHFWNLHKSLNILKKKKLLFIATLFRKLQTVKDLVTPLSKKHRLRRHFDSEHVKGSQTLVKSL